MLKTSWELHVGRPIRPLLHTKLEGKQMYGCDIVSNGFKDLGLGGASVAHISLQFKSCRLMHETLKASNIDNASNP